MKHATHRFRIFTFFVCLFCSSFSLAQSAGEWYFKEARTGDRAVGRQYASIATHEGQLYLMGGFGKLPIQKYDPLRAEWTTTKSELNNIHHFQARELGGLIYIAGALNGHSGNLDPVAHVLTYEPKKDDVKKAGKMPKDRARGAAALAVYQGQLYLVGGLAGKNSLKATAFIDRYDPETEKWVALPDAPQTFDGATAEVINERLYVVGGTGSASVQVFDLAKEQWLMGDDLPQTLPLTLAGAMTGVLSGQLIVTGGVDETHQTINERTFALSPGTGVWTEQGALIQGRQGINGTTIGERLYIAAGTSDAGDTRVKAEDVFVEFYSLQETIRKYDGWAKLHQANHVRAEAQMIEYRDEFYLFTGFEYDTRLQANNEVYNPATDTWRGISSIPDGPNGEVRAATHTGIALVDGIVWVVGGRIGNHPGRVTDAVWLYDIAADRWSEGPALPARRGAGGLARLGNELHYVGGFDENASCDVADHYVYDLGNPTAGWQDYSATSPMPDARNHFGTVVLDGRLYAVGGQHGHDGCGGGHNQRVVHVYDPISNRWRQLADLPTSQSHNEPGIFAYNEKIYSVGGQSQQSQEVWEYDPKADRWSVREDLRLPVRLIATGARPYQANLYVMGGGEVAVNVPRKDVRVNSFDRNTTRKLSFHPKVVKLDERTGVTARTLLSNLSAEDEVAYRVNTANLPKWLQLEGGTGTARQSFASLQVRIDTSQLTAGSYVHELVAEADGYTAATLTVKVEITTVRLPKEEDTEEDEEDTEGEGEEEAEEDDEAPACEDCPIEFTAEIECGVINGGWRLLQDPGTPGTISAVFFGSNNWSAPTGGSDNSITLRTDTLQAGSYALSLRLDAIDNGRNSIWISVDNGPYVRFWKDVDGTNLLTEGFEWKQVNDDGSLVIFELSEGEHTITLVNREAGTRLDRLYLGPVDANPVTRAATSSPCGTGEAMASNIFASINTKQEQQPFTMTAFPNPASGILNVRLGGVRELTTVRLIDAHGRVLTTITGGEAGESTLQLEVGQLPGGLYRIVALTAGERLMATVVVR